MSGVNYFFSLTTIISPYQRQLLLLLDCKDQSPKLWECGNPAGFAGFPRAVERVENLGLVFHAFHGPAFPQLSFRRAVLLLSSVCRRFGGSGRTRCRSPECALDR